MDVAGFGQSRQRVGELVLHVVRNRRVHAIPLGIARPAVDNEFQSVASSGARFAPVEGRKGEAFLHGTGLSERRRAERKHCGCASQANHVAA